MKFQNNQCQWSTNITSSKRLRKKQLLCDRIDSSDTLLNFNIQLDGRSFKVMRKQPSKKKQHCSLRGQ